MDLSKLLASRESLRLKKGKTSEYKKPLLNAISHDAIKPNK